MSSRSWSIKCLSTDVRLNLSLSSETVCSHVLIVTFHHQSMRTTGASFPWRRSIEDLRSWGTWRCSTQWSTTRWVMRGFRTTVTRVWTKTLDRDQPCYFLSDKNSDVSCVSVLQVPDGATVKVLSNKTHPPLSPQGSVKGESHCRNLTHWLNNRSQVTTNDCWRIPPPTVLTYVVSRNDRWLFKITQSTPYTLILFLF